MKTFLAVLSLCFLGFENILAQQGRLDSTFGTNGITLTAQGNRAYGTAYMVDALPDGRIIAGGHAQTGIVEPLMLVRFWPDGRVDSTFGENGIALHARYRGIKLKILPDSKILILLDRGMGLLRLLPDGREDSSFQRVALADDPDKKAYSSDFLVQPDGKILVCGIGVGTPLDQFCMARYEPNGAPDATFGKGGFVKNTLSGLSSALALQADGKILLTGNEGYSDLHVLRFFPDGSPDPTFGQKGVSVWPTLVGDDKVIGRHIQVLPDGRLRITADVWMDTEGKSHLGIFGLLPDGTPDNAYGVKGLVEHAKLGRVYTVAPQPDAVLYIGGYSRENDEKATILRLKADGSIDATFNAPVRGVTNEDPMGFVVNTQGALYTAVPTGTAGPSFFITKLTPSGAKDENFGLFGSAYATARAGDDEVADMTIQSDGKILLIGSTFNDYIYNVRAMIARYHPDGRIDSTFGKQGKNIYSLLPPDNCRGYAITVQPDGKIIALMGHNYLDLVLKVVRLYPDGRIDSTFGLNGIRELPGEYNLTADITLQPDGKILVAATDENDNYTTIRLTANGSFDTGFGSSGVARITTGNGSELERCADLFLQPDGKILLGGMTGWRDASIVRLRTNGTPDPSFSGDGKMRVAFGSGNFAFVYAFSPQPDGKFLIGGSNENAQGLSKAALMRLLPTGTADPAFGAGGKTALAALPGSHYFTDVLVQPDGKILALGFMHSYNGQTALLARFRANGQLDSTFNGIGYALNDFGQGYADMKTLALCPNQTVLLAGTVRTQKDLDFAVARYHSDVLVATKEAVAPAALRAAFPNPFTDILHIDGLGQWENATSIKLTDGLGRTIQQWTPPFANSAFVETRDWPSGFYLLSISTNAGVFSQKLVKGEGM